MKKYCIYIFSIILLLGCENSNEIVVNSEKNIFKKKYFENLEELNKKTKIDTLILSDTSYVIRSLYNLKEYGWKDVLINNVLRKRVFMFSDTMINYSYFYNQHGDVIEKQNVFYNSSAKDFILGESCSLNEKFKFNCNGLIFDTSDTLELNIGEEIRFTFSCSEFLADDLESLTVSGLNYNILYQNEVSCKAAVSQSEIIMKPEQFGLVVLYFKAKNSIGAIRFLKHTFFIQPKSKNRM